MRELRRRGYRVVDRNVRAAGGEADVVCVTRDDRTVVVVEVKSRVVGREGPEREGVRPVVKRRVRPEASVTEVKRRALRRVGEGVVRSRGLVGRGLRVDVVAVEFEKRGVVWLGGRGLRVASVRHYEDVR